MLMSVCPIFDNFLTSTFGAILAISVHLIEYYHSGRGPSHDHEQRLGDRT